ncbi:hypothetical protein HETIRDRAFT_432700 [Heterobasidion irregulare TC 32-1]|uniref:Uncharacterized protein n=1 Tax=Heterobasidion irregulare (strain TC 32-1) TaxID=747525 RepID=W4KKF4_HETIT|nr:uncharacterized protein HETIRDRAFT_432700 [Heterobasidion irregulare TC 32-1]ETW86292.1 hypothetical protein HETIRDRAFT_432700 [Heterobasidion irregulare TC 32-1]
MLYALPSYLSLSSMALLFAVHTLCMFSLPGLRLALHIHPRRLCRHIPHSRPKSTHDLSIRIVLIPLAFFHLLSLSYPSAMRRFSLRHHLRILIYSAFNVPIKTWRLERYGREVGGLAARRGVEEEKRSSHRAPKNSERKDSEGIKAEVSLAYTRLFRSLLSFYTRFLPLSHRCIRWLADRSSAPSAER